jgi:hypothetical protein
MANSVLDLTVKIFSRLIFYQTRDWILKLAPNDNLGIHHFSLDYPRVMTPLSNTRVILVCMSSTDHTLTHHRPKTLVY